MWYKSFCTFISKLQVCIPFYNYLILSKRRKYGTIAIYYRLVVGRSYPASCIPAVVWCYLNHHLSYLHFGQDCVACMIIFFHLKINYRYGPPLIANLNMWLVLSLTKKTGVSRLNSMGTGCYLEVMWSSEPSLTYWGLNTLTSAFPPAVVKTGFLKLMKSNLANYSF